MDESLNLEIWDRLIGGKSLECLSLNSIEGRVDLRNLRFPEPTVLRRFQFHGVAIAEVDSGIIHGVK